MSFTAVDAPVVSSGKKARLSKVDLDAVVKGLKAGKGMQSEAVKGRKNAQQAAHDARHQVAAAMGVGSDTVRSRTVAIEGEEDRFGYVLFLVQA
jgi:hypothetical protein